MAILISGMIIFVGITDGKSLRRPAGRPDARVDTSHMP